MKESILNGKRILAVDDEPDVLEVLGEEILGACPNCQFEKATHYEIAEEKLRTQLYDAVILDIMGVRGFDLLKLSVSRNFSVAMLTAHALFPEALKRSIEMGARAYLPKEKIGEIVPFLEAIFKYANLFGWERLFENLGEFFNTHWGENWWASEIQFWRGYGIKGPLQK
jgi:DNA-binding response OmpR family regulator